MELYRKVNTILSKENLRSNIECLDIYSKKNENKRNITLRISVSNTKKTLTVKDFQKIKKNIEKAVKKLSISILQ
jgi:phenylalanyl-tRNA synthetase beta subunit